MIQVGIKELKNGLSRYLALVKAGDELIVTEHGKPIARITQESTGKQSVRKQLIQLAQEGLITMPSQSIEKTSFIPIKIEGKPVSEMVIEDRR